jgi:hypothetical protein
MAAAIMAIMAIMKKTIGWPPSGGDPGSEE